MAPYVHAFQYTSHCYYRRKQRKSTNDNLWWNITEFSPQGNHFLEVDSGVPMTSSTSVMSADSVHKGGFGLGNRQVKIRGDKAVKTILRWRNSGSATASAELIKYFGQVSYWDSLARKL